MYNSTNNILKSLDVNDYDIYLRKSRKDMDYNADESIEKTLERHEKQLQDYAKKLFGKPIPEQNIFREVVSGDTIDDRPQMQEVLRRIEDGSRVGIIVLELERLARGSTIDQGIIAQTFEYSNTKILTPTKIYDLSDEFDKTYFEDGLYQARKFLQYVKRALSRGRVQSVREGKFVGSTTPFGYDKTKLENQKGYKLIPNEDAEFVKLIFKLFTEDNIGTTYIAHYLNDLGIKSKTNTVWSQHMVRNILINPVYCGKLTWYRRKVEKKLQNGIVIQSRPQNKKCMLTHGLHDPIISEEEFETTQNKLKSNSFKKIPSNKKMKNPLAGLVICGYCNKKMQRRPHATKDNYIYPDTLMCRTMYCQNVSSDLKIVEERILEGLRYQLKQMKYYIDNYEEEYLRKTKDNTSIINSINKDIQKLNKQHEKACEMLELGIYSTDTFKDRSNSITSEIKHKEAQKSTLEDEMKEDKTTKYKKAIPNIENCLKIYYKLEEGQEKNKLLNSVLNKAIYKKDKKGRWNPDALDDFELDLDLKI